MNDQPIDPALRRGLKGCGGALMLLALVVLVGRFGGQPALVSLGSQGSAMAFPSAMAFLVAGAAFYAHGSGRRRAGTVAASVVLLLGAGSLMLYAIDKPLEFAGSAAHPAGMTLARGVGFDGRMSLNGAVSFALLGSSILLLGARAMRPRLLALTVFLLLAIALLAVVSDVTGLRFGVNWWRHAAMAMHTATGFLVAGVGLLLWWLGRMAAAERAETRALPIFVVAGTAVFVLGAVLLVSNEQRQEGARLESHTVGVEAAIDRFVASVARLESSTRAFALTGDAHYLPRLQVHRQSTATAAETLVKLTADNPPQHARALSLRPLIERKFAINDAQVRARQEGGSLAAAQVLREEAPELMAGLRAVTEGLQTEERRLLLERRAVTAINERRLRWVLLAGALTTIGIVTAAFALVSRAQRDLMRANDALEGRVRARTAELQASEAQLRESERRLRFLADTMPQLVWTARLDGTIESLNRGWLGYLGVATEAEGIAALTEVVHPEDRAVTAVEWEGMFREQRQAGGELRLRRVDGEFRWHLWRAHPERDAAGRVVRWIGTSTDIHDKKLAEVRLEQRVAERTAELATSEERFRQAFYFAGTGMAIVGLDGRWVRVNKSICDIVGYTEVELLQKSFQDLTHPDDLDADLAHVRELLDGTRRFYQMEKRYIHRNGHAVWIRLTASLVRDMAGVPVHFVSQVEDIAERKSLEVSLAAARDQALEASRLKSEFLATMSHEIRTPMNGVIGMTALLRDTPLTETQSDYVRTIESSGESLLTIINDILDYSKIEAGRIELEVTTFDLGQCIEDALDLFAARALEKRIELIYLMGPAVPAQVAGDVTRLRQVLVNLLGNAVKFTETGEVVVTVDVEPEGDRHRLRFAIKDTGIGIAPAGMERLFKSFSQVDASTTRRFGGTGLGLAISKRLVEVMGGEMWAESRPGEGSIFHFTALVDAAPQMVQHNLHSPRPELAGRALLVVDDNATNRRFIAGLAAAWGMEVREEASARSALVALAGDLRCDVALIDMHMPEMDGEQLASAIRELPAGRNLPLVLLTSLGRRARRAHFAQTLAKPLRPDALFTALRDCLRPAGDGPGSATVASPVYDSTLGRRCPLRLLVAEDNAVNQRVAALLLQRLGFRSTTVANGLEVLAAVEMADYDAILMDVEMPELDGCEATRRIRAIQGSKIRPWIIALTAGAMQGDRERALSAGMNDFLTKPVRSEALSEALARGYAALSATAGRSPEA